MLYLDLNFQKKNVKDKEKALKQKNMSHRKDLIQNTERKGKKCQARIR
jgi:hypothetical protein